MQIAYAHGIFNTTNALIFLPLIPALAWFVTKIIPGKLQEIEFKAIYLDERLLATPAVALDKPSMKYCVWGNMLARHSMMHLPSFYQGISGRELALQKEELINELNRKITDYMVKIQRQNRLPEGESEKASGWFQLVNDIERIGDHAENIVELSIQHQ